MSATGKRVRLARMFRRGRLVMIPFDDDLINGPFEGLIDPLGRIRETAGHADAILGYRRLSELCAREGVTVPFVRNLSGSTVHRDHTRKVLVGTVEAALRDGCDAVAVHVNISSAFESSMLGALGVIGEECDRSGMPLVAIMYPRREENGRDDNYLELRKQDNPAYVRLVRHCVRVGVELGADLVKTQYTGDLEGFASVVDAAMGVPVIIAGGPKVSVEDALDNAHGAIRAGAAGVCFGRNSYNRTDPARFVRSLSAVVHDGRPPRRLDEIDSPVDAAT
ncbi:fructose-bisphosphate aldolase [Actinoplanes sp. NPDC051494]|uniref:fructose-bisphosphate aldolase n=1 Tax=Actinoplanes sp. NPDC051494 TaxID=3363907 RepID=UPI003790C8D1